MEHLIFIGSEKYPQRGFLDKLATECLSNGTNAYTSDDHTCYTASTPSFQGLLRLLPVYLDHILRPLITDATMQTEVFSLAADGEPRGVVYSEMKGREHSEADQMDLRLRNNLWKDPSTYRWECGGLTQRICRLTRQEVVAYHSEYYRNQPITVFISGPDFGGQKEGHLCQAIFDAFREAKEYSADYAVADDRINVLQALQEPLLEPLGSFPSDDESLGSVGLAWKGPSVLDNHSIMALTVLLRALKETSASPLSQHFVERPDPIANDVDFELRLYQQSMLVLIFSGVKNLQDSNDDAEEMEDDEESVDNQSDDHELDWLEPGRIQAELLDLLKRIVDPSNNQLFTAVQVAIQSMETKLVEQIEEDPHELTFSYLIPEIISNPTGPVGHGGFAHLFKTLTALKLKNEGFWKDLIVEFLLESNPTEVIMKPSSQMHQIIKQEELQNLAGITVSKIIDSSQRFSGSSEAAVPVDPSSLQKVSKAVGLCSDHRLCSAIQISQIEHTNFSHVHVGLSIKDSVDDELWPYLVIFQECIFQCDLKPSDSESIFTSGISYQDIQRTLAKLTVSHGCAVGFGNELFSVGHLDSHLVLSASSSLLTPREQCDMLLDIVERTIFAEDRVLVISENLQSQLIEAKQDPSDVIESVFVEFISPTDLRNGDDQILSNKRQRIGGGLQVDQSLSIFAQEPILAKVLASPPSETVAILNKIREQILRKSCKNFIHIGCGKNYISDSGLYEQLGSLNPISNTLQQIILDDRLPRYGRLSLNLDKHEAILVQVSAATASQISISVPVDILPMENVSNNRYSDESIREYHALAVLCHALSYTEGPLYTCVRGKGLAYGAHLGLSLWNGLLTLEISESTDTPATIAAVFEFIKNVINETSNTADNCEILCKANLALGKALQASQFVWERSTPASLLTMSLRSAVRGLPEPGSSEEDRWQTIASSLVLEDLMLVARKHLSKFLLPNRSIIVVLSPADVKATETFLRSSLCIESHILGPL